MASIRLVWSSGHLPLTETVAWVAVAIFGVFSTAASNLKLLTAASRNRASPASNVSQFSGTTSVVTDSNRLFDRDKAFTQTITPGERSKHLW